MAFVRNAKGVLFGQFRTFDLCGIFCQFLTLSNSELS